VADDSSSITVASTTPSQCKSNAALAYFASFGMGAAGEFLKPRIIPQRVEHR